MRLMNNRTATSVLIVLGSLLCLWFGGIMALFLLQKSLFVPALNAVGYQVRELELKGSAPGGDIYFLGLGMKFPPEGFTTRSAVPFFASHRIEMISVFLAQGDAHAGNVLIMADPDDPRTYGPLALMKGSSMSAILFPGASAHELLDRMHRADAADFSWWNGIGDARLLYLSYLKVVLTPAWYHEGRVFRVKTPYYSGYLAEGRYSETQDITELMIAANGTLYRIIILAPRGKDFKDLLSTLRPADANEAKQIIGNYSEGSFSRDLILASMLSRRTSATELEELLGLIEARKKAGERTVTALDSLRSELEYLKGTAK